VQYCLQVDYNESSWRNGAELRDWVFTTAAMARDVVKIVSYNLHGLNNGRSCFTDLCNDPHVVIIAVQEHWLPPDKLFLVNGIHPEFSGCGISSMSHKLISGVFHGRPYGGVGFLWRKKLTWLCIGYKACSGRIMSMKIELHNCRKLNVVSVYFPCFAKSCDLNGSKKEYVNRLSVKKRQSGRSWSHQACCFLLMKNTRSLVKMNLIKMKISQACKTTTSLFSSEWQSPENPCIQPVLAAQLVRQYRNKVSLTILSLDWVKTTPRQAMHIVAPALKAVSVDVED